MASLSHPQDIKPDRTSDVRICFMTDGHDTASDALELKKALVGLDSPACATPAKSTSAPLTPRRSHPARRFLLSCPVLPPQRELQLCLVRLHCPNVAIDVIAFTTTKNRAFLDSIRCRFDFM